MFRSVAALGLAALMLSACGPTGEREAPTPEPEANLVNEATGGNDLAAVLEMTDAQRRMVFARALDDADIPCDGVVKAEQVTEQDGLPVWRATCKNGTAHAISITPDGTANIMSRPKGRR